VSIEFTPFTKIARLRREVVITEKIDGTNAAIVITPDLEIHFQSRKRLITPQDDNFNFARWGTENKDALIEQLGIGLHFGEWWGSGIQRGYGLTKGEKRFSLFNVMKWHGSPDDDWRCIEAPVCHVVPTLATFATFDSVLINECFESLRSKGSSASPKFMSPEGIVIFHSQNAALFKLTFENDSEGKGTKES